jgi:NAD(P)-dependent dehydrogenase (short-subunit alcohol dehydrogenase family)
MDDGEATAERFARQVYQAFVVDLSAERLASFCGADADEASDPIFARIAGLCKSLSANQREVFALAIRQVATDALASFLAVIEGGPYLEGFNDEDFRLTYGSADVGRDIAQLFLGEDERHCDG